MRTPGTESCPYAVLWGRLDNESDAKELCLEMQGRGDADVISTPAMLPMSFTAIPEKRIVLMGTLAFNAFHRIFKRIKGERT